MMLRVGLAADHDLDVVHQLRDEDFEEEDGGFAASEGQDLLGHAVEDVELVEDAGGNSWRSSWSSAWTTSWT